MRPVLSISLFALAGLVLTALGIAAGIWLGTSAVETMPIATLLRSVSWAQPTWLVAAALPVLAILLRHWLRPRPPTMRFSRAATLRHLGTTWAAACVHLPDGFRVAAGVLLAAALARPQSTLGGDRIRHEGIDIVIALDLSQSMEAPDLVPNRLEAAKAVVDDFIRRRPRDRIGVVVFGSTASTVAPLTMDHNVLRSLVRGLRLGVMDGSLTAIGPGLGVALNRLEESEATSKVIVLLTDGVHNADGLDPDSAAQRAHERGVRIYTVLMGRQIRQGDGSVDPSRLERIAGVTGGYAYAAADVETLQVSLQDLLDKLERSEIEGQQVRPELFPWLLWPALVLLAIEVLLRNTRLRRFP